MTTIYLGVWTTTSSATIEAVRFLSGQAASCLSFLNNKFNEKVTERLAAGTSFARRIRARVSLSANTEQEGNRPAEGSQVPTGEDLRNLEEGNQTVIQDFGNQNDIEEENQDDIQGGDPHGRRYDVVEVYMQLVYGRLKIYKILMAFNMAFSVQLISDIAPLKGDLFRGASVVISVVHAFVVVLINRCDAFLWIDIWLLTGEVLVTTANFL